MKKSSNRLTAFSIEPEPAALNRAIAVKPLPALSRPPPITTTTPRGAGHRSFPSPRSIFPSPLPLFRPKPNPLPPPPIDLRSFSSSASTTASGIPSPCLSSSQGYYLLGPSSASSLPTSGNDGATCGSLRRGRRQRSWSSHCTLFRPSLRRRIAGSSTTLGLILRGSDALWSVTLKAEAGASSPRRLLNHFIMQLVKNVFLTSERKISRKFFEGILYLLLEKKMTKWEILYSFLSKVILLFAVLFGCTGDNGYYGIESASLFYFRKHPSLLNLGGSALLAGILPSPETFKPSASPTRLGQEFSSESIKENGYCWIS
ncbi:Transglycosylase [Musa troglodytarum]|uniref:Transglycosylase n=1 Tax=Musa troglodytarum TaxID=320322 RepID=A0A9E7GBU0_9LILI|nr:Transglycosylase [Musa troglodytarum]